MALWTKLLVGVSIFLPLSSWGFLILFLMRRNKKSEDDLFYYRHNCVVMYSRRRMTGWPEYEPIKLYQTVHNHFQPIHYFISTAKESLDIAVMALSINSVGEALIHAKERGVDVRIIVDFLAAKGNSLINKLEKSGIEVRYYVPPIKRKDSIMHYKYMVKDYTEGLRGFVSTGSMNWTITGLFNNYENIVFSSDLNLAKLIHENFTEIWNFIQLSKSYDVKARINLQNC